MVRKRTDRGPELLKPWSPPTYLPGDEVLDLPGDPVDFPAEEKKDPTLPTLDVFKGEFAFTGDGDLLPSADIYF